MGRLKGIDRSDEHSAHVGDLIAETLDTFSHGDAERVHRLIPAINEDAAHYDSHVAEFVMSDMVSGTQPHAHSSIDK